MMKVVLVIVAILVLLPLLPYIFPKPLTIERIEAGLKERGFTLEDLKEISKPMNEADQQWTMKVNGARTDVYYYTDSAVLTRQREYQRKDAGTAIVETWNLRESLGAAPNPNLPSFVGRNQKFMMIVTTRNKPLGERLIANFKDM